MDPISPSFFSYYLPFEERPYMYEINTISIETSVPEDYDYSWFKRDVIFKFYCKDGLVLIFYSPKEENPEE